MGLCYETAGLVEKLEGAYERVVVCAAPRPAVTEEPSAGPDVAVDK
jgi:hypothetical protein